MTMRSRRCIAATLLALLLAACSGQSGGLYGGDDGAATQEPAPGAEAAS